MRKENLKKSVVLSLILCGGMFSCSEVSADNTEISWPNTTTASQQGAVIVSGTGNNIVVTSGTHVGYTINHGNGASIQTKGGAGMNFAAGTVVKVYGDVSTAAHRLLHGIGGTGNYAGTIYLEENGTAANTPLAKFENDATANFLTGSQTDIVNNVEGPSSSGMGINNSTLNTNGNAKLNITTKGGVGLLVETGGVNKAYVNIADTSKVVIDAKGSGISIAAEQRANANAGINFTTGANTVLDVTSHATGALDAALYVRENATVQTNGVVVLKNTGGNAIVVNPYANDVAANITIDGQTNKKLIQITGNILYNVVPIGGLGTSNRTNVDKINISMGENDLDATQYPATYVGQTSFFKGNHDLGFNGQSKFSFASNSYWEGDNIVHSETSAGIMQGEFKDSAYWKGNNSLQNGTTKITFAGTTAANKWEGNNTVSQGDNTIILSGKSSWTDGDGDASNTVTGGTNTITLDGDDTENKWKGNNNVSGGTNRVNLLGLTSTWEGTSTVSNTGINEVTLKQQAKMLGNTTITNNASNKFFLHDYSEIKGNTVLNDIGKNQLDLNDNSKFIGDITINGGYNVINMKGHSVIDNGGAGTITTNGATVQNYINAQESATIKNNLINNLGQTVGLLKGSATIEANNTTVDGTTFLQFSETSKFVGNNELTGLGENTITLAGNTGNTWTGTNTVTGTGVNTINLNGSKSEWTTVGASPSTVISTVQSGTNNINISNTSTMTGTQSIVGGTNNIDMIHSGKITGDINITNTGKNNITITDSAVIEGGKITTTGASAINVINASGTNAKINNDLINDGGSMKGTFSGGSSLNADNNTKAGRTELLFADTTQFNGDNTIDGGTMLNTLQGEAAMVGNTTVNAGNSILTIKNGATVDGYLNVINGNSKVTATEKGAFYGNVEIYAGTNTMQFEDKAELHGNNTVQGGDSKLSLENDAKWTGNNYTHAGTNTVTMANNTDWHGDNTTDGGATSTVTMTGGIWHDGTNITTDGDMTLTVSNNSQVNVNNTIDGPNAIFTGSYADTAQFNGDNTINDGQGTLTFASDTKWNGQNNVNGGAMEVYASGKTIITGNTVVTDGTNLLDASGSTSVNGGQYISGGTNTFKFIDSTALNGETEVTGGTNTLTAENNATISGNVSVNNNAQNDFVLSNDASLTGDLTVDDTALNTFSLNNNAQWVGNSTSSTTGQNDITLADASKWQGAANDTGAAKTNAVLGGTSTWYVTGDSNIFSLDVANGTTVDMIHDISNNSLRRFNTLTVDTLSGTNTTFMLETDLDKAVYGSETTDGDKLVVNGTSTGTHFVQVADESLYTGTSINGSRKLLLITDESGGNYQFQGKKLDQGGLWQVNPPTLFQEGNKWYLGYIEKEANPDTTVSILDRHTVYNQWTRINNDSLRKRLGDLRYNDTDAGVWARIYGGKLSGEGYKQRYNTMQVGVDKTIGQTTYGIAMDKQTTSQNYEYGHGEGSNTNGSIYVTHYTDGGTYWDVIGKYGKINSKYSTIGQYPDHADYDTKGYSLSMEYGKTNNYKNGYFVEPKIQLTYGYLSGENYLTDRNTLIREDGIRSLMSRIGVVAGRKINKDSDYYLKANWFREFKGDRTVHMTAANGENMFIEEDLADSWFEIGLGGNVRLANKTHLYGDVERSIGADVEKKWQINAGVRFEF